jgi:hypothetical protein
MAATTGNSSCSSLLSPVAEYNEPLPSKLTSTSSFQVVFTEALPNKFLYSVTILFQFVQQTEFNRSFK